MTTQVSADQTTTKARSNQEIVLEHLFKRYTGNPANVVDDVSLTIPSGEFMVLVGPSGCGKSTLLRMIAGLEEVTDGHIYLGGREITELAPRDRDIAMVFQNYALYPHMSVRKNLAYGLRVRKTPKNDIDKRVGEVARMLGLDELLDRRPAALSGGQRQRVAMGRAIAREPQAFLMDEPLSNLDAKLRVGMRAQLSRLHQRLGITTVYVTHDQVEAMTLGQRVCVMRDGVIQQVGPPQELYARPVNLFVAVFLGSPSMNLVQARVQGGRVEFGTNSIPLSPANTPTHDGEVVLGIRPSDFRVPDRSAADLPRISADVALVEELGSESHVIFWVDAPPFDTETLRAANEGDSSALLAGDQRCLFTAALPAGAYASGPLSLAVDPGAFHFFDVDTGVSLNPDASARGRQVS